MQLALLPSSGDSGSFLLSHLHHSLFSLCWGGVSAHWLRFPGTFSLFLGLSHFFVMTKKRRLFTDWIMYSSGIRFLYRFWTHPVAAVSFTLQAVSLVVVNLDCLLAVRSLAIPFVNSSFESYSGNCYLYLSEHRAHRRASGPLDLEQQAAVNQTGTETKRQPVLWTTGPYLLPFRWLLYWMKGRGL